MTRILLAVVTATVLLFGLTACEEKQGPAEELGEKVDNAVESAGEKVEEAGDAVKDATN